MDFNELIKEKLYAGEIIYQNKRLIFCLNEEEKERERLKREEIISFLKEKLKERPKDLIKDSYFKKYLKMGKGIFKIDREKIKEEEKFDGVYSLITNTDYPVKKVVLRYKELWQVESIFRDLKNVFKLGPVFHRTEEKGRRTYFCKVFKFCSF
ncbi:MAG: transposase [Candidatus Hydrothermales bacterium]